MWNVRPVGGSSILVVNLGFSLHFRQGGEVGFLTLFSMAGRSAEKILQAS
jgi:hypothetical protein